MNIKKNATHVTLLCGVMAFIIVCLLYPFLPGDYDVMAVPLATTVSLLMTLGLLLVPVGILWLIFKRTYGFALTSVIITSIFVVLVCLFTFFSGNKFLGILLLVLYILGIYKLLPNLKSLKKQTPGKFNPAPLYLIFIPILSLVFQLVIAGPLTKWSRDRAIVNSSEFIGHIEEYHKRYDQYPVSLLAQWKDYYPDVIGIEKYHYSPQGDSYNLFFEQPRFFLDNFGTREWVVYNPDDQQKMYSHTSWFLLLSPEEIATSQGWYEVHDTQHPHWKYFWFD